MRRIAVKRLISMLTLIAMLILFVPTYVSAEQNNGETIYFEDGSYIVTTITEAQSRAATGKSGAKTSTYYGNDGTAHWKATLSGSFTYDGSSATCTSSSCSVTIYNNSWYTLSKSASKSGNSAFGSATMGYKVLGITTNQVTRDISLTCDKDGNLS